MNTDLYDFLIHIIWAVMSFLSFLTIISCFDKWIKFKQTELYLRKKEIEKDSNLKED